MKRKFAIFLIFILAFSTTLMQDNQVAAKSTGQPMKKYVTEQATFVLYMPEGWKAKGCRKTSKPYL